MDPEWKGISYWTWGLSIAMVAVACLGGCLLKEDSDLKMNKKIKVFNSLPELGVLTVDGSKIRRENHLTWWFSTRRKSWDMVTISTGALRTFVPSTVSSSRVFVICSCPPCKHPNRWMTTPFIIWVAAFCFNKKEDIWTLQGVLWWNPVPSLQI